MNALDRAKAYLVGGGIASLSAAVLLIRDGGFRGANIFILEELEGANTLHLYARDEQTFPHRAN